MNIVNPIVEEYVDKYYRAPNEALKTLREECEQRNIPIVLKSTEAMLAAILKIKPPQTILEIGTAVGYSTIFFAVMCDQCSITTIEKNEEAYHEARRNIHAFHLRERVRCLCGDAAEILSILVERVDAGQLEPFDFVFIDAAKSHYKEFWERAIALTHDRGVIVCDNVLLKGSTAASKYDTNRRHRTNIKRMREFIDHIMTQECADTYLLSEGDGLTISIKKGK